MKQQLIFFCHNNVQLSLQVVPFPQEEKQFLASCATNVLQKTPLFCDLVLHNIMLLFKNEELCPQSTRKHLR